MGPRGPKGGDERGLDDVVRLLAREPGGITNARFRALAEEVAGTSLAGFYRRKGVPAPKP